MVTSRGNGKITVLCSVPWELEGRKSEDFNRVQDLVNSRYAAVSEEPSHLFFSLAPLLRAIICTIRRFFWPVSTTDAVTEASILCSTHPGSHWCVSQGCSLLLCCAVTHQSLLMLLAESALHSDLPKGRYYFFFHFSLLNLPSRSHCIMSDPNSEHWNTK